MTGAEVFARELRRRGVRFVSTLCGHGMDPLDEAFEQAGIRLVDVRNEQAAGYIAEAAGRLSRRVGVCAVSSGVAHLNALTGVANAHFDGAPMLLITGCGPTETIGLGHFQDFDQLAAANSLCKYVKLIDRPERIQQYLHEAFSAATTGRPGPVHLTFPLDVQEAEVTIGAVQIHRPVSVPESLPGPMELNRIASMLSESEQPLIVAGSGLYYDKGERALQSFSTAFDVPVVVPIWDRGAIPEPMDTFMGVLGAATGGPDLLSDADLILMLGARCDYRVGYLQQPEISDHAAIVRVDADASELDQGTGAHVTVQASPRVFLSDLRTICEDFVPPKIDWMADARSRKDAHRKRVISTKRPEEGCHALDVVNAIGKVMTSDTTLVVDGGNIGQWAHQVLNDRYPGHWLTCGASGVVGYGIPGAMAARLLDPERPVILLSGDGASTFTIAELETASRQNIPFVMVVADDTSWGITLTGHEKKFGRGITSELGPIDFVMLARSLGALGVRVDSPEGIEPAIREALTAPQPTVIHVPIVQGNPAH
jgi:acetolactate synthase I/II/III large subunit